MIAALLIAGAAIAHATWNIALKRAGASGVPFIAGTIAVGVIVFAPFGISALLSAPLASPWWPILALGSGLLQIGYFLLLQRGYRMADVGVVYPLARGTGPLLSVIAAVVLLGDRPGPTALVGALLVVAGVVIIGLAGARASSEQGDDTARRWRGVRYGAAVGALIAGYTLWDAVAVTSAGLDPIGYYWLSMVVQLALLLPIAVRSPGASVAVLRAHPIALVIVGVLSPLAYVAVLYAYQLAPVSIVAPAREVSVVLIALAGWLLLREPHPVLRIAGSLVVLGGVALLAL